jgi:hypothetical protein
MVSNIKSNVLKDHLVRNPATAALQQVFAPAGSA